MVRTTFIILIFSLGQAHAWSPGLSSGQGDASGGECCCCGSAEVCTCGCGATGSDDPAEPGGSVSVCLCDDQPLTPVRTARLTTRPQGESITRTASSSVGHPALASIPFSIEAHGLSPPPDLTYIHSFILLI